MQTTSLRSRNVFAGLIGITFEYYDFFIFLYLGGTLANKFTGDLDSGGLHDALVWVTYLARPLGGILFGHFGDRYGRKKLLICSMVLVPLPVFLVGILPTGLEIGYAGFVALVIVRLISGVAVGGELSGAGIFLLEWAPKKHQGFFAGTMVSAAGIGALLAYGASQLALVYPDSDIAFRVPFIFGIVLAVIGLWIRVIAKESELFLEAKREHALLRVPAVDVFRKHFVFLLLATAIWLLVPGITDVLFNYVPTIIAKETGLSKRFGELSNLGAFVVYAISGPIFGKLIDRFDAIRVLKAVCLFLMVISPAIFILYLGSPWLFILIHWFFVCVSAGYFASAFAAFVGLFPVEVRYSALALAYNMGFLLFALMAKIGPLSELLHAGLALLVATSCSLILAKKSNVTKHL